VEKASHTIVANISIAAIEVYLPREDTEFHEENESG